MPRLPLDITPEFAEDLDLIMKKKGLETEAEAVRFAVHETAKRLRAEFDYSRLLGFGNLGNTNPNPRFESDDDIWEKS